MSFPEQHRQYQLNLITKTNNKNRTSKKTRFWLKKIIFENGHHRQNMEFE